MQVLQAVRVGAGFQARAQFLRARRGVGKTFEQSAQIQPGPDGQDGKPRALAQVFQDGNRSRAVFARREWETRVHQVQQVMRNAAAFFERGLGRANIETAIDLRGIAGQDIALQFAGQRHGERGFAGSRRTHNGNERERVAPRYGRFFGLIRR